MLIAGTGTKSGKTTMACRIIEQYRHLKITAIKITPHFHETTQGLRAIAEEKGYAIYEETESNSLKDTSRMLCSGADKVYFAKVYDNQLNEVFRRILYMIPKGIPIICESPALREYAEPGVFIIMTSDTNKRKNINKLQALPHVMFRFEELDNIKSLPIRFENGSWQILN